ncbi:MAG: sigma 54-interacting transcriptional regulator [Candidatus Sulfotelmatobacter sp.]
MELNKTPLIESVFAGRGEVATQMRSLDWSTTALGPVEQWPQALRTALRIVLGSGYPMTICWGPDFALLYNDAIRPVLGTKHPWALGRFGREVYPEAWDFIGQLYEAVLTRGQEASFLADLLVPIIRNNYLEETYFAFSCSPIPDDNGQVGGVLTALLETTDRVLEDRRRHVLRDLASRTVGARNEEEVWHISAETLGQDRLSLPFTFLYEYRPSERQAYLTGVGVETDDVLHPPVIDCHGENLWRFDPALGRDGVVIELGDRASRVTVPNWPVPPKEASVLPIRLGEYGEALGFLVVGIHPGRAFDDAYRQFVHRITEQITIGLTSARAYTQERQRAEALAEIDRAKTTFFGNVSHEFRTPLALMLGPLEEVLLEARDRLGPESHEQLVVVRRNGLRLLKLVNTLLDFSRIEAGRVQATYQLTDLASFTAEVASAFDSAMDNAGLRFSVECQPIAEPVYVDRDMWEKVVLNLLSNALKFTFEGEVALTLKNVDGVVELQVRDTGVGIPEEHLQRVFERFHRIEGVHARTYEGTGIGLALVQELVKLHGGSVRVESALGQGSTFTVTIASGKAHLPAERIQAAEVFASTKIRAEAYVEEAQQWLGDESGAAVDVAMLGKLPLLTSSPEPTRTAKRELILLADDNTDMRRYLLRLLGDRYEVHAVADGSQALEATRQLRPALVLADIMMPRLDGFGVLRAIRDDSALASTPVILLSARAGEESRVEGLQADADDYLVKPFSARELLARVATHVKMANLRRETAEREERLRSEAVLEREKLRASEERLLETSRLYRQLEDRERKIRRLVDANILGITSWNVEGAILAPNEAFLRMVQYDNEDVAAGRMRWRDMIPENWRERADRALEEVTQTGTVQPFESEFIRKDGSRVPVLIGATLFQAGGNEGVAFVLDLSEQKRAEAEIRALKDQLYKENLALRDEVERTSMFDEIVGASNPLKVVLSRIAKVAPTDSTVLITGETGTGKELVARAIHRKSARAERAFVSVNCAAIPRDLIPSELFGHEKGAFTGATQRRLGRFELADGGTIFLDEVGELLPDTQVALLRVLQERELERVGGRQPIHVNVRVITATNRDLEAGVANGTFRQDLFYRLNVFPIEVPPLRERKTDLLLLVEYFVQRYGAKAGKDIRSIDKKTLDLFQSYDWPGNIRELQNVIERSVILSSGGVFSVDELWLSKRSVPLAPPVKASPLANNRVEPLSERESIETALAATRGRVAGPSGAAAKLGIPPSTLEARIKALKINKLQFKFR